MAIHPQIQRKCQTEIDELFESDPDSWNNGTLNFDAVHGGLKYLERCIMEAMRLYPAGFVIGRKLTSPLDLTYKGSRVRIPSGWSVAVSPYLLHRNKEYFPNPNKFDPDRFLSEVMEKRHAYAYIPFSAGPRNCIGQKFSILELKTIAAYLLRSFEFDTIDKIDDIPLLPSITLKPERNYRFQLKRRIFKT